jgi:hypothetical protein
MDKVQKTDSSNYIAWFVDWNGYVLENEVLIHLGRINTETTSNKQ